MLTQLKTLKQWVVWRYEVVHGENTKVPYQANGARAATNRPDDWMSYEQAAQLVQAYPQLGLGFVLTEQDDFACIDLDAKKPNSEYKQQAQQQILDTFNSYAEMSPSGKGLHIWVKGKIPDGARFDDIEVEIYSSNRYITITERPYRNQPIENRQHELTQLYSWIRGQQGNKNGHDEKTLLSYNQEQTRSDKEIFDAASAAANGDKFLRLWNGDFKTDEYKPNESGTASSEADFALIDMLGFHSNNMEQVNRMFFMSIFGQREKYKKRPNLVHEMVVRSFDRKTPPLLLEEIKRRHEAAIQVMHQQREDEADSVPEWTTPPSGLMGDIAQFVYQQSIQPMPELAIGTAISFMAGLVGRAYNVSHMGLNQYVIILAKTGYGKESARQGVAALIEATRDLNPAILHCIGPSSIASPQGIARHIAEESQCFLSVVGEVGLFFSKILNRYAKPNEEGIKRFLLDVYNASGIKGQLGSAAYSDKQKNVKTLYRPCVSLLGESTQAEFYKSFDESSVIDGFIPRFTIMEYTGTRPQFNDNHSDVRVSPQLAQRIADMLKVAKKLEMSNQAMDIPLTPDAKLDAVKLRNWCFERMDSMDEDNPIKHLWNRVQTRALKIAGLLAVGENPMMPVITQGHLQWSKDLSISTMDIVQRKFERGEVGQVNLNAEQEKVVNNAIERFCFENYSKKFENASVTPEMHQLKIFTWRYITAACHAHSAFRNDRNKPQMNMKLILDDFVRRGIIRRAHGIAGFDGEAYQILQPDAFVRKELEQRRYKSDGTFVARK
jgi:hypothetical protein